MKREVSRKALELEKQHNALQAQIDEDWRIFVESKGGPFLCMHKPTDLLQTVPPFHPLPDIRFLYFHAEEGLRYLFILKVIFSCCLKGTDDTCDLKIANMKHVVALMDFTKDHTMQ
jgi:hypothetical protein